MSGIADGRHSRPRAEVLLAGATERPALAAARSLSRRGIPFVVVGNAPRGMIAVSRHVRQYVCAPSPRDDAEAFFAAVLAACVEHDVRLVMPMDDAALA